MKTRLTEFLGIEHPIISAPMALAAGGELAAAVTAAGGLGLLGGGYGDPEWLEAEFRKAGNTEVGCGFITWSLANNPDLLDKALSHKPKAMMLSFGDTSPFVKKIKEANVHLVCQVQSVEHARDAVNAGAHVIVAQGSEAGGHGDKRATFTLVPEIADYLAKNSPETILVAAGGIADGRGLAAALMLGAEGVLIGSRFWASSESLAHRNMIKQAIKATGDETIRSSVMDIARNRNWPKPFTARVLNNEFTKEWHGKEMSLAAKEGLFEDYQKAWNKGDTKLANTFVGEATGLIKDAPSASEILNRIVKEANSCLSKSQKFL